MQINGYKNNLIVSLSDTSDNVIKKSLCMDGFARHQFLLVDKPGYTISQEVCETKFTAGDVIYAAAGKYFGIRCDDKMRIQYIAFTGRHLRSLLHYCNLGEFSVIRLSEENKKIVSGYFDRVFSLNDMNTENSVELSSLIYSLIGTLGAVKIEEENYVYDKSSLLIKPIIDYMQKNYRFAHISYDTILTSLGMTLGEMNDMFYNIFSMSPDEYYKKLRMENAKHLLFFYSNRNINYIAKNMGYDNDKEFLADFADVFHMTPNEFLAMYY